MMKFSMLKVFAIIISSLKNSDSWSGRGEMKHDVRDSIVEYVYVIVGAAIIAIGFNVFLLPNQVASGGVSGISIRFDNLKWLYIACCHDDLVHVRWLDHIPRVISIGRSCCLAAKANDSGRPRESILWPCSGFQSGLDVSKLNLLIFQWYNS